MPTIFKQEDLIKTNEQNGWVETNLADSDTFGHDAMIARGWSFAPGGRTPEFTHGDFEQFIYVISGSGSACVNGETLRLDDEAVLWLERGDRYYVESGPDGLEILVGIAPG